jgi:hypothetical protein
MGFEDEAEQSFPRPCRQTDGGFKRTCELTSSIILVLLFGGGGFYWDPRTIILAGASARYW